MQWKLRTFPQLHSTPIQAPRGLFCKKKILFLVGKMLYMSLYRNKKFILDDVFQQNASKFVVLQKQPTY